MPWHSADEGEEDKRRTRGGGKEEERSKRGKGGGQERQGRGGGKEGGKERTGTGGGKEKDRHLSGRVGISLALAQCGDEGEAQGEVAAAAGQVEEGQTVAGEGSTQEQGTL